MVDRVLVSDGMRHAWLAGWVLLSGCYREGAAPLANARDPLVQRGSQECGRNDDLRHPPLEAHADGRLRTHTSGPLSGTDRRDWSGDAVPKFVPERLGTLELFILDEADGGHLAFYREPYGLGSCALGGTNTNCAYTARFYTKAGTLRWSLDLGDLMSRRDQLEVQDIRLADGVLYFNEACQSYAADAGGACSSLVAVDPQARRVMWRTDPLVSNGRFLIRGCYVVAGYGFTAEPDAVFLVDRGTGAIRQKIGVSSAPERYKLVQPDELHVTLYAGNARRYALEGFDTDAAMLRELDPAEFGGAGYGGMGYSGAGYGGASYGGATYGGPPRPRTRK